MAQNDDLHLIYAEAMKHHPFGFALYHPCNKSVLKIGSCGYFNHRGDWNSIADISSSNETFTGIHDDLQKAEPHSLKWGPKCSDHVREHRVKAKAGRFGPR